MIEEEKILHVQVLMLPISLSELKERETWASQVTAALLLVTPEYCS